MAKMKVPKNFDVSTVAKHMHSLIELIGENVEREGLIDTPIRAAKAWEYLTSGYRKSLAEIVNNAVFTSNLDEMIIVKNTEIFSLCEHHMLPFIGKCHVAYLPKGKVLGLSKIPRIIEMFTRRLQIQEELTQQIANAVMEATSAKGVGVIIEAQHLCMLMRGVEKQNSVMTTSVMLGGFRKDYRTRSEFLNLIAAK